MKTLIQILACFFVVINVTAQSEIQKSINIENGQNVNIEINDANLIDVKGWDENYISINATIQINNGINDDSYKIETHNESGAVYIAGFIQDKDQLPRIIQIKKGDQIYSFNTDDRNSPEIKKFYEEHGQDGIQWTSHGVMWTIKYEISVPQNTRLKIDSKFGLIDIENFNGNLQANSKHGGVDLAVKPTRKIDFNLKSEWGEIFTDLKLKFNEADLNRSTEINCKLNGGGGPVTVLESKHGNIYLREMK